MRTLTLEELDFLSLITEQAGTTLESLNIDNVSQVAPLDDGCMGSLQFIDADQSASRSRSHCIVDGEFQDEDDVLVSFELTVDRQGRLYELDLWRVDFAPLVCLPTRPEQVTIKSVRHD